MEKKDNEDILQEEIEEEKQRIEKDERIVKLGFLISSIIFIFVVSLTIILFYKLKDQQVSIQSNNVPSKLSEPTLIPTTVEIKTNPSPTINVSEKRVSSPKEYFVSFGSGTGNSTDWSDVGGLQATVDVNSYGKVKEVRFETSIQVPGENQSVSVRLYNKTDNHPVWGSELTKNAGSSSYVTSGPLTYDTGSKTYTVQMKTQLGSTVSIGEARLHIILE